MSSLESLPPEVLLTIVEHTNAEDHLSLPLTCKTFYNFLPGSLQEVLAEKFGTKAKTRTFQRGWRMYWNPRPRNVYTTPHALTALVSCHVRIEEAYNEKNPDDKTALLACTGCGKLKNGDQFVDGQRHTLKIKPENADKPFTVSRLCNPCAVKSPIYHYSSLPHLRFHGMKVFLCRGCTNPFPMEQEYKGKRIKSSLKYHVDAMPASKWCEPCARKVNEKRPGVFKELKASEAAKA